MPFRFQQLEIPDVVLIEARSFPDSRGFFIESYKKSDFSDHGIHETFVQDNYSHSVRDTLRGLHYQKNPRAQAKLVMVLTGEIFDVVVDVRRDSPTYGKYIGIELSAIRHEMLYVPVGLAHGFCVLSGEADVLYKVTQEYSPESEAGIIWNDPEIGIQWPVSNPVLTERDCRLPRLREAGRHF